MPLRQRVEPLSHSILALRRNPPWFTTMNARTLGGGADLGFAFVDFVLDVAVCVFDLADFIPHLRRLIGKLILVN
jgi:hypothetical protein